MIFLFIILMLLINCQDPNLENETYTVEEYVNDLTNNSYHSSVLPEFSPNQIPELLSYCQSTNYLYIFPTNPLSSYYQDQCKLGFLMLWTVESIRLSYGLELNSQMDRYPSQNPIIEYLDSVKMTYVMDQSDDCLNKVAENYSVWWSANSHQNFSRLRLINPLENTNYKWH